jgi:LysM repeat protein
VFAKFVIFALVATIGVLWLARPSGSAGPEQVYVVKPTDTLWSIATRHYAGDPREVVWKLRERNHLPGAVVRPGQRIVLPSV